MEKKIENLIDAELKKIKKALEGQNPVIIQDVVTDAEEFLFETLKQEKNPSESAVLAATKRFGDIKLIAKDYQDELPMAPGLLSVSSIKEFFSIFLDPGAWRAVGFLIYRIIVSLPFFVFATAGLLLSLAAGLLTVGLPLTILYFYLARQLAVAEGKIVQELFGVAMPTRNPYHRPQGNLFSAMKRGLTDPRTWGSLFYMILTLPLSMAYLVGLVAGFGSGLSLMSWPVLQWGYGMAPLNFNGPYELPFYLVLLAPLAGLIVLAITLFLAKLLGRFNAALAKNLLVKLT